MDLKLFLTIFTTIFVAELGDKTQLATLLYAAEVHNPKLTVFAAAATALVLTSALGVIAGGLLAQHLNPRVLSWVAGLGFIAIGLWTIFRAQEASLIEANLVEAPLVRYAACSQRCCMSLNSSRKLGITWVANNSMFCIVR